MAYYSDSLTREVRLERMRPEEVEAAKAAQPAIYVAFGSIEWHGYHNPVGLDAVKAHEQLVGLASRVGGVVYPAVFLGAGGGHTGWPSTFMVSAEPMVQIVTELLWGFERDGYRKAILISGHYPNRPEYLDAARATYLSHGGTMKVLALIENEVPGAEGDHAAKYETSYMLYLHARAGGHDAAQGRAPGRPPWAGRGGELDGARVRGPSQLRPRRHRSPRPRLGGGGAGQYRGGDWVSGGVG